MNRILQITGVFAMACCATTTFAQLNPTITGDNMLCPEGTGTVTTQTFDSYQWYVHPYGTNDTNIIAGETSQTLNIDYYNYAPSYLIVEVTANGETEMSPEFMVDGWAFASISVMTNGNFTTGNNGESIICDGDTLFFEVLQPYTTNVTWFDGGDTIQGQNAPILAVTEAGSYTVSGSPGICPDFVQYMGIPLDVVVENCSSTGLTENKLQPASIYPNPATDNMTIEHPTETIKKIEIRNTAGQLVRVTTVNQLSVTISMDQLRKGTYFVTVTYNDRNEVLPLTIQ